MSVDIVDELRGFASGSESARASLMRDAADEIERLRGEVEWEYAVRNLSTGEVFEPVNGKWWRTTDNEESVRRRPASDWEPIPEGGKNDD